MPTPISTAPATIAHLDAGDLDSDEWRVRQSVRRRPLKSLFIRGRWQAPLNASLETGVVKLLRKAILNDCAEQEEPIVNKKSFASQTALFPKPTVLVGAHVKGKPNFLTVALAGFICGAPPTIALGIRPDRYTLIGIVQNRAFSVNVPSLDMVAQTDYCGIVSGASVDKVEACGFRLFYGATPAAPLIEQCPVNLECEVLRILELGSHHAVIGKVTQTHVSENCLTQGAPDMAKINPILFSREHAANYYAVGGFVAQAFRIGLQYNARRT